MRHIIKIKVSAKKKNPKQKQTKQITEKKNKQTKMLL